MVQVSASSTAAWIIQFVDLLFCFVFTCDGFLFVVYCAALYKSLEPTLIFPYFASKPKLWKSFAYV